MDFAFIYPRPGRLPALAVCDPVSTSVSVRGSDVYCTRGATMRALVTHFNHSVHPSLDEYASCWLHFEECRLSALLMQFGADNELPRWEGD
jgi:hypothetical protein